MTTTYEGIVARIDRLPVTRWHNFVRFILGFCTFFDFFDAAAIAYVLPVLIGLWHLSPSEIGLLIASGFVGQLVGAMLFGWVGERYGRIFTLNISILFVSLFGLGCAFAWSYPSLIALRFLQGIGIGGEAPMAVTYVNEISKTERRGRFVLLFQIMSPVGLMGAAIVGSLVVPYLGWQWMFIIGAAPALAMIVIRRSIPRIAPMARAPRQAHRGRPGAPADRGERARHRAPDHPGPGRPAHQPTGPGAIRRSLPRHLFHANDVRVGDVVLRQHDRLRADRLAAVAVSHRLQAAGRAVAAITAFSPTSPCWRSPSAPRW